MVSKKEKQNIAVVSILALIILVATLSAVFTVDFPVFSVGTTGLVKSVDLIDSISNDADLDRSFFRVTIEADQGGDSIVANFDNSEFNRELSGTNYKTDFDVEIGVDVTRQRAIYPIRPGTSDDAYYDYGLEIHDDPIFGSADPCPNTGDVTTWREYDVIGTDKYCFTKEYNGRFGDLDDPTVKVDAQVDIESGNNRVSTTLSNFGENSGPKDISVNGKKVARARISQASDSVGANPPDDDNYRALYLEGSRNWRIVEREDYSRYLAESRAIENQRYRIDDVIDECKFFEFTDTCLSREFPNIFINVNREESNLLNREASVPGGRFDVLSSGISNSKVEYETSDIKLADVEIVVDVLASWVGVKTLTAQPEITDLKCDLFTQNGNIEVIVNNKGQQTSTFDVDLLSCGSMRQTADLSPKSIASGESDYFNLPIDTGDVSSELTETCQVRAFNTASAGNEDVETVTCRAVSLNQCTPGEQVTRFIDDNVCVLECTDQGSYGDDPVFCCENGVKETRTNGVRTYECSDGPPVQETCESCKSFAVSTLFGWANEDAQCTPKPLIHSFTFCFLSFLQLLILVPVFIFALLFGVDIFRSFKALQGDGFINAVPWILSVIVAFVIALIVYFSFWIGLIVGIVYLGIRFLLPVILPQTKLLKRFKK